MFVLSSLSEGMPNNEDNICSIKSFCSLWGGGRGWNLCNLKKAPQMQKCPKTSAHECRICMIFLKILI